MIHTASLDQKPQESIGSKAMRKILLIARYFPPEGAVGSKRVAYFARYLPASGIEPIVLTVQERFCDFVDPSFPVPAVRVIRTPKVVNPLVVYKNYQTGGVSENASGDAFVPAVGRRWFRGGVFRQMAHLCQLPDLDWNWYWPAVKAAKRVIESENIELILSSGPPWTCHLIARELKRKFGIPWIADFRDAWMADPWRSDQIPRWRQRIERRWESKVIHSADRVMCVIDEVRDGFSCYTDVPKDKFVTLTNGVDLSDQPVEVARKSDAKKLILHLGSLYGDRRVDTFCRVVGDLVKQGVLQPDGFKVVFMGWADRATVEEAQNAAPDLFRDGQIEFRPKIKWAEAQQYLYTADLLLIFQGTHFGLSAKAFEYLRSGIPILAIGKNRQLVSFLDQTGSGLWADPADQSSIASAFLAALSLPVRRREEVSRAAGAYEVQTLTRRLAGYMEQLITSKKTSQKGSGENGRT